VTVDMAEAPISDERARSSWMIPVAIGLAIFTGVADGTLAFAIESPGASLVGSCLLIAFVAVIVGGSGWWLSRTRDRGLGHAFLLTMGAMGVLATGWAWAFAMPAAMAWDARATPNALAALKGIPPEKSVCQQIETGSIGPLSAPFERCAVLGSPGPTVTYYAGNSAQHGPARGLIFFEGSPFVGSDEFIRHLVGDWYAFTEDPSGRTGYSFTGGV
jgi:hypothetical protein